MSAVGFDLPAASAATRPPEHRGLVRDEVRLLVARPDAVTHQRFRQLPAHLAAGDLVVVNTSATLPAALTVIGGGTLHVAGERNGEWIVEPRLPDGPDLATGRAGAVLALPGLGLELTEPYPDDAAAVSRLWRARPSAPVVLAEYLHAHGRPITYDHLDAAYPLTDHQTVFGTRPGSAEMASAGRPFTAELVVRLITAGVAVAPITLHAGVSSPEAHEPPTAEPYEVPAATAWAVNATKAAGGRIVAVGTTVTRAVETVADLDATVRAEQGWTELVLGPERRARVVDGLITGLHAPQASHLLLLEAVAGGDLVRAAYAEAVERHYLWHEFGDSTLFLP